MAQLRAHALSLHTQGRRIVLRRGSKKCAVFSSPAPSTERPWKKDALQERQRSSEGYGRERRRVAEAYAAGRHSPYRVPLRVPLRSNACFSTRSRKSRVAVALEVPVIRM